MENKIIEKVAREYGWEPENCSLVNIGGRLNPYYVVEYYYNGSETVYQVDPETGETRNKGTGAGCFWTDWR